MVQQRQRALFLRRRPLNRRFFAALGAAAALHLAALLIFRISPVNLIYPFSLHPPSVVFSDIGSGEVTAAAEEEKKLPPELQLPPLALPPLLPFPASSLSFSSPGGSLAAAPLPSTDALSLNLSLPRAELRVCGPLAAAELLNDGLPPEWREPIPLSEADACWQRALIEVLVEGATGKIFQQQSLELPRERALIELIDTALAEMRFAPSTEAPIRSGAIEISFITSQSGRKR